jgi:hypothetical protein
MNTKGISIVLAVAFVTLPLAASGSTTVIKNSAAVTNWSPKTQGLTKTGYPVMRMFSVLSFGASIATTPLSTAAAVVKNLKPK